MKSILLFIVQLAIIKSVWSTTGCPVEDDPSQLARCIQIDVTAIVEAIKGSKDFTSFCALANRYMECFNTYTRGCVGQYFVDGAFAEIQNIAQYCCNGISSTSSCPFNPSIQRKCIDSEANVVMADGSRRAARSLEIGDKVKTVDESGHLVDTDVVMMMDINDNESLFLNIRTHSGKSVKVSTYHLMAVPGGDFKFAQDLRREDAIVTYDFDKQAPVEERIASIMIESVVGYVAPLTMSGTLLVDGILASCYAVIDSHKIAHTVMAPARWLYSVHGLLDQAAPEAVTSHLQIEKQMNGTHWYPALWESFTHQYLTKLISLH